MRYIWQQEEWPNFTWQNEEIEKISFAYAMEASALIGKVSHLSSDTKTDALIDLMVSEAIKTSEIEGEHFDREDVRSSIRNQLGLNTPYKPVRDPRANGLAALMISVRNHFKDKMSENILFKWHDMLIADPSQRARLEVGKWRTTTEPMQIVSGAIGREKVHFEAPASSNVPREMQIFIDWFNRTNNLKGAIKAGVAHLYFESIHPFADGNGRIGRAISETCLSQELGHPVLLSLSTTIEERRNDYYDALSKASTGKLDITDWLIWFTQLVHDAQLKASEQIDFVLSKTRFWDDFASLLNVRQTKIIQRMLREGSAGFTGGMSAQKYAKITGCSKATATRDLADLQAKGCLKLGDGGGRSTSYDIRLVRG